MSNREVAEAVASRSSLPPLLGESEALFSPSSAEKIVDYHQFIKGLGGTAGIVVGGVVWLCFGCWVVENSGLPRSDLLRVIVASVVLAPSAVSAAFLITAIMMWYGRLLLRFAIGCFLLLPCIIAFYVGISFVSPGPDRELFFGTALVVYTLILAAAAVAVAVQLVSSWVLVHSTRVHAVNQLGISMIVELMVLASVACAFFLSVPRLRDYLPATILFVGIGALGASMAIHLQVTYLSEQRPNWRWLVVTLLIVTLVEAFIPACIAAFVFLDDGGVDSSWWVWAPLLVIPLLALIAGVLFLQLLWLYACGWRCVDRRIFAIPNASKELATASPFDD